MKIKKYNEIINYSQEEDYDYEEEEDFQMSVIGWGNYEDHWGYSSYIYILEDIDGVDIFILNGYKVKNCLGNASGSLFQREPFTILTEDELNDHIYNNETPIMIIMRPTQPMENNVFKECFWKDLPEEIKNKL